MKENAKELLLKDALTAAIETKRKYIRLKKITMVIAAMATGFAICYFLK